MNVLPIIRVCPEYSSERYYLLSELEQIVQFTSFSEAAISSELGDKACLEIVYFLWDVSALGTLGKKKLYILFSRSGIKA